MKKNFFALYFLFLIGNTFAQLSKTHYLPPIYEKEKAHGSLGKLKLFISTPSKSSFYVKIYEGVNPSPIDSLEISSTSSGIYELGDSDKALGLVSHAKSLNTVLNAKALTLEGAKPFIVNVRGHSKSQGFSLTSKGKAALGTSFRTGYMLQGTRYTEGNKKLMANFVSVMATADDTEIKFSDFKKGVQFYGLKYTGRTKAERTSLAHTVTLNKGQSYIIASDGVDLDPHDGNKEIGLLVSASKAIAVTTGSVRAISPGGTGSDVGLDQIVPVSAISNEYILISGQGNKATESPVLVATQDNTMIEINGKMAERTLDAGDYMVLKGNDFSEAKNLHLKSNYPICVYQTTAGGTSPATCGLNFVPPLNECANANFTAISDIHFLGDHVVLNIVAKVGSPVRIVNAKTHKEVVKLFSTKSNLAKKLDLDWTTYRYVVPKSVDDIAIECDASINVSLTVQSNFMGAAAYFSGFLATPTIYASDSKASFYAKGQLTLKLGEYENFDRFKWFRNDTFLIETTKPLLTVDKTGGYTVAGIDKSCSHKEFISNAFLIEEAKCKEVEEVPDVLSEEPHQEFETAIKNNDLSPVLINLNYVYNDAAVVEESYALLDSTIATLKKYEEIRIRIVAHTDCRGNEAYNLKLSERRAQYVKEYMIKNGIAEDRLEAKGMGETSPLPSAICDCEKGTCTEAQLALNRRSEFIIIE